jgi:hypothetical protein
VVDLHIVQILNGADMSTRQASYIYVAALAIEILIGPDATARAADRARLSCAFYDQLSNSCKCGGKDDYLLSYGRKYCDKFLNSTGWSPAGALWRDRTLVCLQKSLAQKLPRSTGGCDCSKIKEVAFETHIQCYTQASASICRLPSSDIAKIYGIIDATDLFSSSGIKQMISIANICIHQ